MTPRLPQIAVARLAVDDSDDYFLYMGKKVDTIDLESLRPGMTVVVPISRITDGSPTGYLSDEAFEWLNTNAGRWQYFLVEQELDRAVFFVYDNDKAALFKVFFG